MFTDHRGGQTSGEDGQNPDRRFLSVGFKMVKHMVGANGQTLGRPFHGQRGLQMGPQTYQRGGRLLRDRSSPKWSEGWSNLKKEAERSNCGQVFDHFCNGQTPDRENFDQVFDHVFRCGDVSDSERERNTLILPYESI